MLNYLRYEKGKKLAKCFAIATISSCCLFFPTQCSFHAFFSEDQVDIVLETKQMESPSAEEESKTEAHQQKVDESLLQHSH